METVISWDVVREQLAAMDGHPGLEILIGCEDAGRELIASVWVDNGIRDEEGVPTEFDPPIAYLTLTPRGLTTAIGNIPVASVPIIAAALRPLIRAAGDEAWRQANAWCDRFEKIFQRLKDQRSTILRLREKS